MAEGLAFERLHDATSPAFAALLALYHAAIPAEERKPDARIAAMAGDPNQHLLVARAGRRVLGFAILYAGETLALLEYLAVDAAERGRGTGAAIYRHCRAALPPLPLLVEVESDAKAGEGNALRTRRKAFYRRLGCRELKGLAYILPLGADPPAIDLLVDNPADFVPRDTAAAWLTELYTRVYGCNRDDPRLARMIAALPERLELA